MIAEQRRLDMRSSAAQRPCEGFLFQLRAKDNAGSSSVTPDGVGICFDEMAMLAQLCYAMRHNTGEMCLSGAFISDASKAQEASDKVFSDVKQS